MSTAPPALSSSASSSSIVTPWEVTGPVDYDKIVSQFGAQLITSELVAKIERKTHRRAHHFLRRSIFFSHRDLDVLLDGEKDFYLYTGRGPSSDALHFGHLVPLLFTRYLQEAFDVPLVVQLTDDEKFLFKDLTLEETQLYARENARDILALGFDVEKTFLFSNTDYVHDLYPNVLKIQRATTASQICNTFGFNNSDSIGKWAFPPMQMAPSFVTSFPDVLPQPPLAGAEKGDSLHCVIPCAIDQDPYFRLTRFVAPRLGYHKPALVHSKFFPALQGAQSKMSSTKAEKDAPSTIFLNDTPERITNVVKRYAFSGGGDTLEAHRAKGGNLAVDVPYQWLRFFMEDDDRLQQIATDYSSGRMLTGEIKQTLATVLIDFATKHQQKRAKITDEDIDFVMSKRQLQPHK